MLGHMRTTVRLNDRLPERARREARRRHVTLTSLIERGLELVLAGGTARTERERVRLPVCREGGGTRPGIVLSDTDSLLDELDREA